MRIPLGLSYDDVLLVPQKTDITSRATVDTSTRLTKNLELNIPIISANMDTVTEAEMAITMAMAGGIGIIHRFLTIEEQAAEVSRTKRHDGFMVDDPRTLSPDDTLETVYDLIDYYGSTGFVVVDEKRRVLGLLSKRDFCFENNRSIPVSKLMTPVGKLVIARPGTTRKEAEQIFREHKIEKLPVVDKDGTLRGLITAKALVNEAEYPHSCRDRRGRLLVGAAVGVKPGDRDRVKELVSAGADVIVVDIAHGHAEQVLDMTRYIKENFSVEVISGNVATSRGVRDLVRAGADAVKVGIGAGSVCITRIVAGAGYPQFSAVANCAAEARKLRIPIIADGNIRAAGDVAKAIGGGADSVMVGSLLAGTDESPGMLITRNDKKYKVTRGMASLGANMARKLKDGPDEKVLEELREYVAEGVEALVPYRGKAEEILGQLVRGLQSGMSYSGANSILQMQKKAKFVQVTQAGIRESLPHDVEVL